MSEGGFMGGVGGVGEACWRLGNGGRALRGGVARCWGDIELLFELTKEEKGGGKIEEDDRSWRS